MGIITPSRLPSRPTTGLAGGDAPDPRRPFKIVMSPIVIPDGNSTLAKPTRLFFRMGRNSIIRVALMALARMHCDDRGGGNPGLSIVREQASNWAKQAGLAAVDIYIPERESMTTAAMASPKNDCSDSHDGKPPDATLAISSASDPLVVVDRPTPIA